MAVTTYSFKGLLSNRIFFSFKKDASLNEERPLPEPDSIWAILVAQN